MSYSLLLIRLRIVTGSDFEEIFFALFACLSLMVLENGKWIKQVKGDGSPVSAVPTKLEDENGDGDSEIVKVSDFNLPYEPHKVNQEYLRESGNLVYTVFPEKNRFRGNSPKHHRILLVVSTPVKAK